VRAAAHRAGLTDDDLVVDSLVLTAATDPNAARVTLDTVRAVSSDAGLVTVLGVSNVSHGLPGRPAVNATFLAMARAAGLDAAIVNPGDLDVVGSALAADVLLGRDDQAQAWVDWSTGPGRTAGVSQRTSGSVGVREPGGAGESGRGLEAEAPERLLAATELAAAIVRGDADSAPALVESVIAAGTAPTDVIGTVLTPAIQDLGDKYGRGEVFLPQLMVAADAMKAAVARVKELLPEGEGSSAGKVVFATVKGDIHSIGKDICISLLESQGYEVDDLGVDVPADQVRVAAGAADAVCLSALMTTTLPAMQAAVDELGRDYPGLPVFVGGAVVTREWADSIGAGYSDDAPGCVLAVSDAIANREARAT
jgi:5-methyltetrahydrofolate--homocysteine methyltransferase